MTSAIIMVVLQFIGVRNITLMQFMCSVEYIYPQNPQPPMNDFDLQEMHLESTLFPWLDSDCMSDLIEEQPFDFDDYINSDEDY